MAVRKVGSPARNRRRSDKNPEVVAANGGAITDRVALRAYELFLARGGQHGRDIEDWLEAEREIVSGNQARPTGSAVDDPARGDVRRKAHEQGAALVSEID
jgi:Protein of unknown function (DUF2934)